jgi:DNA helicase TIP49 (TBP-interacting protein)
MNITKKDFDRYVKIVKKYYRTGDVDLITHMHKVKAELEKSTSNRYAIELIQDLSTIAQWSGRQTYEQLYKAYESMGYVIDYSEEDNNGNT